MTSVLGEDEEFNCGADFVTTATEQQCNTHVCPIYTVVPGEWDSECPVQCDGGVLTRTVACVDVTSE